MSIRVGGGSKAYDANYDRTFWGPERIAREEVRERCQCPKEDCRYLPEKKRVVCDVCGTIHSSVSMTEWEVW